jgi:hypothetical protein
MNVRTGLERTVIKSHERNKPDKDDYLHIIVICNVRSSDDKNNHRFDTDHNVDSQTDFDIITIIYPDLHHFDIDQDRTNCITLITSFA